MSRAKPLLLLLFAGLTSGCASLNLQQGASPVERQVSQIRPGVQITPIEQDPIYQLLTAEIAINSGVTPLAVENYLALARSQNDPAIAERAVRVAVYAKDMDAAQEAAERWIALEPERHEAQQIIAAIYIRQGDAERAYDYLEKVIRAQPSVGDSTFASLLTMLASEKNTETVLQVSKRIADNFSGYAYAHYLHGNLAANYNRPEEALDYLDNALAVKDIPDAHALRAKSLIQLGQREEALVSLRRAVLSKPENKQLRLAYARLLVEVKAYDRARIEFEKLHLMAPNDTDLLYTLGLLSLESQRFDAAETYLSKLLSRGERVGEARYYLGRISESRTDYASAISWYGQVNSGEYRFDARIRSANLTARMGDTDGAIAALKEMAQGSQSKASLVRIYLAKGEILKSDERFEDAMEIYNQGLQIIPNNIDLLYARGLTAEKVDDIGLLERDMLKILETEPDNAYALNALGFTLADHSLRLEEAYQYLKRAIEIKPEDPAIIDSYGWINYRLGNYDEAIRLLRKALAMVEDGEIAAHLGEVLWVSGQQEEARGIWQRALEKSPDNPFVIRVMRQLDVN
jgi:tetratricopeptide (TPR) repeat protein